MLLGAFKSRDPQIDLSIAVVIASAYYNRPAKDALYMSEVGLSGELRNSRTIDHILLEAKRHGYGTIVVSKDVTVADNPGFEIVQFTTLDSVLKWAFSE